MHLGRAAGEHNRSSATDKANSQSPPSVSDKAWFSPLSGEFLRPLSAMSEFHIPTVNISPYLADPTSPEATHVIDAVRLACTTSGFFQLVGHGIDPSIRDAMFTGSKALFKLPFEEKKALKRAGNRGYELMGSQALQDGTLPDLKEVCTLLTALVHHSL